ncbi:hypothetical protein IAR55_000274 [Kwoniella newhampshirensis]|uniref:Rhodanese domain-containing protein n=1 Tax=Kwoniella newhampshirensis TaxID=1651941 RepID=A0AAW0Z677_9TREE
MVSTHPQHPPFSIPIPGSISASSAAGTSMNAIAGPSSEGAIPRRATRDTPSPPRSPSSAPPTPSVISVTHPSQFIHTHHPRRGSMTPLGLNLISPVAPLLGTDGLSPSRSVGFNPNYALEASPPSGLPNRRGSTASTTSTLTTSRPPQQPVHSFYPPNWNSGRRRSSLTPSNAKIAAPSPTRAHVSGQSSRPVSNDGPGPGLVGMRVRNRASDLMEDNSLPTEVHGRRGSLPHLGYVGWAGPHRWNPVLPPPRGSVGEGEDVQLPDEGFKFGSGVSPTAGTSSATAALKAVDLSPNSARRASLRRREDMDAFEQTEADEADRQRRAFLAATYGQDGKRARERLSIGGQGGLGPPGVPQGTLRRQSLLLWERMKGSESETGSFTQLPPGTPLSILSAEDLGPRRGSLPIAIPGGGLGRSSSRRSNYPEGDEPVMIDSEATPPDEGDEEDEEDAAAAKVSTYADLIVAYSKSFSTLLQRPLPPLLPLSDPGPRLLPSTLALHRANHLLNSRNLQAEPLPHPLPPSLHPPDPVDVAEFDIDFILAGSQAQLGQGKKKNAQIDVRNGLPNQPETPILRLGGDEEDTFAKFVGEFDDEYGGRRGDWTFRACPTLQSGQRSPRDPLDRSDPSDPSLLKAEWESSGAGKYELLSNGEVRSASTGKSWRVHKLGSREYELEEVRSAPVSAPLSALNFGGERYTLAGKRVHRDQGGVKLPHFNVNSWFHHHANSQSSRSSSSGVSVSKYRSSISNGPVERTTRFDSEDSTMTMTPALSSSAPFGLAMAALKAKKKRNNKEEDLDVPLKTKLSLVRSRSKEPEGDKKDKKLGGVFKRGILGSMLGTSSSDEKKQQREERERERVQAHSWSGTGSAVQHQGWTHQGRGSDGVTYRSSAPPQDRSNPGSEQSASSRSATSGSSDDAANTPWNSTEKAKTVSSATTDDESSTHSGPKWREGKGWQGVPDDAVAMIIPLEHEVPNTRPSLSTSEKSQLHHPFFVDGPKQALLVWYVPFNSEFDDTEQRPSTASSRSSINNDPSPPAIGSASSSGSLPKFQKLLRRRASKDKDALKKETQSLQQPPSKQGLRRVPSLQPLPFRSFRVVARVVDAHELRSDVDSLYSASSISTTSNPFDKWSRDQNVFVSSPPPTANKSDSGLRSTLPLSPVDESRQKQPDISGRNFPTVIAVCHSRSQGVEFVLEGLDRLGLCKGESAWGPTGYEEWRGTGLSERGRELLDLLWAGCTGVMGLSAL